MALPGIGIFGTGPVVKLIVPFLQKKGFRVEALWSLTLQGLFFIFNTDKQIAILFAISWSSILIICRSTNHSKGTVYSILDEQSRWRFIEKRCRVGSHPLSPQSSFSDCSQSTGHRETCIVWPAGRFVTVWNTQNGFSGAVLSILDWGVKSSFKIPSSVSIILNMEVCNSLCIWANIARF